MAFKTYAGGTRLVLILQALLCTVADKAALHTALAFCVGIACERRAEFYGGFARSSGRHPLPRLLPATHPGAQSCTSLERFDAVVDLSCMYVWVAAVWHSFVDCAIPGFELYELALTPCLNGDPPAHNATLRCVTNRTVVLTTRGQKRFVELLLRNATIATLVKIHGPSDGDNSTCFILGPAAVVAHSNGASRLPGRAKRFRAAALRAVEQKQTPRPIGSQLRVIHIVRKPGESRSIQNQYNVTSALRACLPRAQHILFHGNGSFADAVRLFADASSVVGFHGAGFANTLFSPPSAAVIEFTVLQPDGYRGLWRTTEAVGDEREWDLLWVPLGIDPQDAFPSTLHAEYWRNRSITNASRYQDTPGVVVPLPFVAAACRIAEAAARLQLVQMQ